MACLISIGKIDKKHIIFPIIAIIILTIQNYFFYRTKILENLAQHEFVKLAAKSLGKSLAIIIFLLFKKEIRYSDQKNTINREVYNKEYFENYIEKAEKLKKIKYIIIFLNMILNVAYEILVFHFTNKSEARYFSFWIFTIFYIWGFSFCILNTKLYRHQYLSIIIITILGIIINIYNGGDKPIDIDNIIIALTGDILLSLNLVNNKYLMDNLLFSEYEITFYEGIFSLIISIMCSVIFPKVDSFTNYYDSLNFREVVILSLIVITQLICSLFGLMTIKYYTVFHYLIILLFFEGEFYRYKPKENKDFLINLLLYIAVLFIILVFIETIELNCFGLQKYTKKNIIKRAKKDYLKNCENNSKVNDNNDTTIENSNEKTYNDNSNEKSKEQIVEIDRFRFEFPGNDENIIEEG